MLDNPTFWRRFNWAIFWSAVALCMGVILCGCMPTADELAALGTDHAKVDLDIATPWGSVHFHRENPTTVPTTQPVKP